MDDDFSQNVLLEYYSLRLVDHRQGEERSLSSYLERFPDPGARQIIVSEHASDLEALRSFGRFQLIEALGGGGQGEVWLVRDPRLDRVAALKLLNHPRSLTKEGESRFRREAQLASRIRHPGICTVFEAGIEDGIPFIVMEYVPGPTLRDLIKESPGKVARLSRNEAEANEDETSPISQNPAQRIAKVVSMMEEVARALHIAHEAGVIHRDVKPSNIVVTGSGHPVVLDFGLARDRSSESTMTAPDDRAGTVPYMPPEQLRDGHPGDRRIDVYALGVTLYECLTGCRPFAGPTQEAVIHAVLEHEPTSPRALNRSLPIDLEAIIETAMEKDPRRRYQTSLALADDLAAFLKGAPVSAKPLSTLGRGLRWIGRKPLQATTLGVVILSVLGMVATSSYLFAEWSNIRRGRQEALAERFEGLIDEGFASLDDEEFAAGRRAFDKARELRPRSMEAFAGQVCCSLKEKDGEAALRILDSGPEFPESRGLLILRRDALVMAGRPREAAAVERRLATLTRRDPFGLLIEARLELLLRGRRDPRSAKKALRLFTEAILLAKTNLRVLYRGRAIAACMARDPESAEVCARALQARWPDSARAFYYSGLALETADREHPERDRAEKAYRRALDLDPRYARAKVWLGFLLFRKGEREAAEKLYRQAVADDPKLPMAHVRLAYLLYGRRLEDESFAEIERALELHYDGPETHFNYGSNLVWSDRPVEGIRLARRFLKAWPEAAWLERNLGECFVLAAQPIEAIRSFKRALSKDPNDPASHYGLARALELRGHLDEAIAAARQARKALAKLKPIAGNPKPHPAPSEKSHRLDSPWQPSEYPRFTAEIIEEQLALLREKRRRLRSILDGSEAPADRNEAFEVARLALRNGEVAESLKRYSALLEEGLPPTRRLQHLWAAAGAALRWSLQPSNPGEAAELRKRARSWLTLALAPVQRAVDDGEAPPKLGLLLSELSRDPALTPVRTEAAVDLLPEAERKPWRHLWADLDLLEEEFREME